MNVSQFVQALSVPKEKVDRFFGDIHPFGNPHILLDPERAIQISQKISQQLSSLDPEHGQNYEKNQKNFESEVQKKIKEWNKRIYHSGIKKVVSYHSSFEYFLDRFSIELLGLIEEKPGIPPSIKHILTLTEKIKVQKGICVLMSSFYSKKWVKKIKVHAPVQIEAVAIEVMALKEASDYIRLIDGVVKAIENCGKIVPTLTS